MIKKHSPTPSKKSLFLALGGVLIGLVLLLVVLEKKNVIDIYKNNPPAVTDDAKTTSTTATAQSNFDKGDPREPGNSLKENEGTGGMSPISETSSGVNQQSPIVSKTGEITIYSPQKNTEVQSGVIVSGASTLSKISYRLIDSVSGMIAQGELSVVNGKFSGKLTFSTSANEGRLDIYATRADGAEYSNIELPLRFK